MTPFPESVPSTRRAVASTHQAPRARWLLCFIAAYLAAAAVGQGLKLIPGISITFWPPSGIFVATLLLNDRKTWPWWIASAWVGEMTGNVLWFHNSWPMAMLYFSANLAEAVAAAWLVRWAVPETSRRLRPSQLDSPQNAFRFAILAGGVAPVLGATLIASGDAMVGKHPFWTAWYLVWLGDGTGLLLSAPLTLAAVQVWRHRRLLGIRPTLEFVGSCSLAVLLTWLALWGKLPTVYVALPAILWAAVQFQIRGAWVALIAVVLTVAVGTRSGVGEFVGTPEEMRPRLVALQVFLGICASTALIVGALSARHVRARKQIQVVNRELEGRIQRRTSDLKESEERLRLATEAAALGTWECDPATGKVIWSERARQLFGLQPTETPNLGLWRERLHPEDRARVEEIMRRVEESGDQSRFEMEYRVMLPDGSVRWIADSGQASWSHYEGPDRKQIFRLIGVMADITARKQMEEALFRTQGRLAAEAQSLLNLNTVSSRLWRLRDLPSGLREILDTSVELLNADMGNVQLINEEGVLILAAQRGFQPEFEAVFQRVSVKDDSACGRAFRTGERTVIRDIEVDPEYESMRPIAWAAGFRAVQSTPLRSRSGAILGMISTHWRAPHDPDPQDLRRFNLYARQAADFIERFLPHSSSQAKT